MGPFVPELISDSLNLVVALVVGIGFGAVLEQAGFSSSRRLAGVFYGYDFTVLRVFFTAAVTAMSGILLLGYFGFLDLEAIYINPTWLQPAIVGGVIMGVGFILGGYCPGTSVVAAAIGKLDGLFFVLGGFLGVYAFAELYPRFQTFNDSTSLGALRVYDSLGIPAGWFAFALIAMAVMAFAVTTVIEKKVNPEGAPSLAFSTRRHLAAGALLLGLGLVFLFLPDRKTRLIESVSAAGYADSHPVKRMPVDELAFLLVEKVPDLLIVDVRSAERFSALALPGSVHAPLRDLFGKEWISSFSPRRVKKVLVGGDEKEGVVAAALLRELGYENVSALEGGLDKFRATILEPAAFVPAGNRWDGALKEFREKARVEIRKQIAESAKKSAAPPKKEKKIQGGC